MKKTLFNLTILTLVALTSVGQTFPDNNATWSYYSSDMFGTIRYWEFKTEGDTSINETIYNKVYYSFEYWDQYADTLIISGYSEYQGALRPENDQRRVYFIPKDSTNEFLLYDFNLGLGDTVPVWHNDFLSPITVESIDTIEVNGLSLKRFNLLDKKQTEKNEVRVIVENIGSLSDLLKIENRLEGYYNFVCFKNYDTDFTYPENCDNLLLSTNSTKDLSSEFEFKIFPNPSQGVFKLQIEDLSSNLFRVDICNTGGIKLLSMSIREQFQEFDIKNFENGIYILLIYKDNNLIGNSKIIINK